MSRPRVVLASAVRTPIGKFKGAFRDLPAPRLGALAVRASLERAGVAPEQVGEVFMGCAIQAGLYQNPARQALIFGGIPSSVSATTVNMVCGSAMQAMAQGVRRIWEDPEQVVVAGGMENMTRAPYLVHKARLGAGLGHAELTDAMITDGLWDIYNDFHMALGAERMVEKLHLSREEVDAYALRSHQLAHQATASGRFLKEIVPVEVPGPKGKATRVEHDEGIRPDTTIEALARLPAVFKEGGALTAGNSSQISDGASATVLMSEAKARALGVEPLARVVDFTSQAVPPEDVMFAPIPCTLKLLQRNGLRIRDVGLVEHNEAFAPASVGVRQELDIPWDVFNVHGGAVALGHPIGCSGNRIVVTLVHGMLERGVDRGLATLCIGGGDAMSMVLERA